MPKDSQKPKRTQSDPGPITSSLPMSTPKPRANSLNSVQETQEERVARLIKSRDLVIAAQDARFEREENQRLTSNDAAFEREENQRPTSNRFREASIPQHINRDLMIAAQDAAFEREENQRLTSNRFREASIPQHINSETSNKPIDDQIKELRGNNKALNFRLTLAKKMGIGSGFTREEEQIKEKIITVERKLKYTPSITDAADAVKEDNQQKSYLNKMKNALKNASSLMGNLSNSAFSKKPLSRNNSRDIS